MTTHRSHIPNLTRSVTVQPDGIVSQTLCNDDRLKVVLFGFDAGQELSEHTAAVPAIMHFLSGEADVTLGAESIRAGPNTWVRMDAGQPHSIVARTPVFMLLTLCKETKS